MSAHAQLSERTGVAVYFADPHSPWAARQQREHQSVHSVADLEAIAYKLNSRPRKVLGFHTPLEVYADLLLGSANTDPATPTATVALGP